MTICAPFAPQHSCCFGTPAWQHRNFPFQHSRILRQLLDSHIPTHLSYPARRVCAPRALGLLLADGADGVKINILLQPVSVSVSFHSKSTDGRGQKMLFFLKEYVLNKWGVGLEFLNMSYTINLQIPNNRDETLPQA